MPPHQARDDLEPLETANADQLSLSDSDIEDMVEATAHTHVSSAQHHHHHPRAMGGLERATSDAWVSAVAPSADDWLEGLRDLGTADVFAHFATTAAATTTTVATPHVTAIPHHLASAPTTQAPTKKRAASISSGSSVSSPSETSDDSYREDEDYRRLSRGGGAGTSASAAAAYALGKSTESVGGAKKRARRPRDASVAFMTPSAKRERRKARNRELAAQSRERRKCELEMLKAENEELRAKLARYEREFGELAAHAAGSGGGGAGTKAGVAAVAALTTLACVATTDAPHDAAAGGLTASVLVAALDALDRTASVSTATATSVASVVLLGLVAWFGVLAVARVVLGLARSQSLVPAHNDKADAVTPMSTSPKMAPLALARTQAPGPHSWTWSDISKRAAAKLQWSTT